MVAHAVPESVGSCSWEGMKSSHFLSTPTLPSAPVTLGVSEPGNFFAL